MEINTLINTHGFKFKKQLGQNFITDTNLLNAIVADAKVSGEDCVLEVGAGAGTLTNAICAKANNVISFEVDKSLEPALNQLKCQHDNLQLVFADALKYSDQALEELLNGQKFRLVANLPYYITTPLIFKFLYHPNLLSITIMVQKEVAQRICAAAGSKQYGALSAQVQIMGVPKITRVVSKKLFTPAPEVDSAIVHLELSPRLTEKSLSVFKRTVAAAFAMRRKTLANNLMSGFCFNREQAISVLRECKLSETIRGEELDIEKFILLSQMIENITGKK